MTRPVLDWAARGIDGAALDALAEGLPPSELHSLLLAVAARRADAVTPARLMQQLAQDRFVAPAVVDQRALRRAELQLLETAAAFEAVELSPLAPLGSSRAVAPVSQDRIVSTMRGTEVMADPTNLLALLAAARLRHDPEAVVRLATTQRCVRAQTVPPGAGYQAHFSLFCLATAGREQAEQGFTVAAMVEQIGVLVQGLQALGAGRLVLRLLATPAREHLVPRITAQLREQAPALAIESAGAPAPYYDGLRFMIDGLGSAGTRHPLADGGRFDWVARLAGHRKLAFVASGLGTQLLLARRPSPTERKPA